MLFNSIEFLLFLPFMFGVYWFVLNNNLSIQNLLLVVGSYVFYAWWDVRFLALIIFSSFLDFFIGKQMAASDNNTYRKGLLFISIFFNLGMLFFFKYFNFFIDSWIAAWQAIGVTFEPFTLQIILPVGISFYTFQTLSYTFDVYRNEIKPTNDWIAFFAYVAFFPQLVAGPIERAARFLPQFLKPRKFNYAYASDGIYYIIWGLFKKIVIADNCAFFVNQIFGNPSGYNSLELFLGMILFAFQIYGDFSGYSYIAIGTARLFGFDLMLNFKFPYLSRDIAEFWRRWHISLSNWFRDYLYIPLGGSRGSLGFKVRNVMIVFLVSGFWHGANWTFLVWGFIHGLLYLPLFITNKNKIVLSDNISWKEGLGIVSTFLMVCVAWVFFRAENIPHALAYLGNMLSFNGLYPKLFLSSSANTLMFGISLVAILLLLTFEFLWRKQKLQRPKLTITTVAFMLLMIFAFGGFKNQMDFIYFQF